MPNEKQNEVAQLPRLNDLFFAVCATAIKNCAWKYADFEKVKVVEGQLAALHAFFVDFYQQEEAAKTAEAGKKPAEGEGVEIEMPKQTIAAPEAPKTTTPAPVVETAPVAEQEKKN